MANINNAVNTGVNNNKGEMKMINKQYRIYLEDYTLGEWVIYKGSGRHVGELLIEYLSGEPSLRVPTNLSDGQSYKEAFFKETNFTISGPAILTLADNGLIHVTYGRAVVEATYDDPSVTSLSLEVILNNHDRRSELMKLKDKYKVIKLNSVGGITEKDLMETVGDVHYTLPLMYVIENVMNSFVESGDLDEVIMNHTDDIIYELMYKGEYIYAVEDGCLYPIRGLDTTYMEQIVIDIPYLIELERAADELWGFTRVLKNLELGDEDRSEIWMQIFTDDLYFFVYTYCRELWWDGGSY